MKKRIRLIKWSTGLLLFALSFTTLADKNVDFIKSSLKQVGENKKISMLFVQQAKKLHIQKEGSKQYRISLYDSEPTLIYFSDRPNRLAGRISKQEFLSLWANSSFKPNVVIEGSETIGDLHKRINLVLTLSSMKINADDGSVSYTAEWLPQSHSKFSRTDDNILKSISNLFDVTIFIDNYSWGQG